MKYSQQLQRGELIRRYKRFLADVALESGETLTIHCPNTGSMKNCAEPGYGVWFSQSDNPKRKYAYTWELAEDFDQNLIGINTIAANKLANEAIATGVVSELAAYQDISTEVRYGEENSRIDLLLTSAGLPDCYVEVKSVTLRDGVDGYFPDAVSTRGQKHLRELARIAAEGHRAVLLFCVQHTGIKSVAAAKEIDPDYAQALNQALTAGVEVLAYGCDITPRRTLMNKKLPFLC